MSTPVNTFITEGNVEIYLSRLRVTWNSEARDVLVRLLAEELSKMDENRVHFENGERRVFDGRKRLQRQREIVQGLPSNQRTDSDEAHLLETLEKIQDLLERHLSALRERFDQKRL